ncbi:MAG: hemerythrin family protein [Clostridiales bacterium]|nr:hemerythrin family protein [Clostridiales bacterium]
MAKYEMKPEYYTGIKFIDEEHEKLFDIASRAYDLLMNEFIPDKYDYIMEVIDELKDYTKYHFDHEEAYMSNIKYRRLLSQKVAHDDFIEKINEYDSEVVDENQKESLLELLEFLTTWLIEHIYKQDKLIADTE